MGLQKRGPRLLGLSLVCTVVAFVLAFRHATTVDRLARWDCALAQLSLAEDQMANDIKDMHVKARDGSVGHSECRVRRHREQRNKCASSFLRRASWP